MVRFVVITSLLLAGCAGSITSRNAELLSNVPADTMFISGTFAPVEDSFWDAYTGFGDLLLDAVDELKPMLPVGGEMLRGKLTLEGMADLGIESRGPFLIFTLGVFPVVRVRLSSVAAFERTVQSLVSQGGLSAKPDRELDGRRYRTWSVGELRIVFGIDGRDAVLAMYPASRQAIDLPLILGARKPRPSLADTAELDEITQRHGLATPWLGVFDFKRLAAMVTGDNPDRLRAQLALMDVDLTSLTAQCARAGRALAGHLPRLAYDFSYTDGRYRSKAVWETSQAVAQSLQKLVSPMAGLGPDFPGRPAMGLSLNLKVASVMDAMGALGKSWADTACEPLRAPAEGFKSAGYANKTMSALVRAIGGAQVVVHGLADDQVRLHALLKHADLVGLIKTVRTFGAMVGVRLPELADGAPPEAFTVPLGGFQGRISRPRISRVGDTLAVTFGPDMDAIAGTAVRAAPRADNAAVVFVSDKGRLLALKRWVGLKSDAADAIDDKMWVGFTRVRAFFRPVGLVMEMDWTP